MNLFTKIILVSCILASTAVGCKAKPKEIAPAHAGARNDSCQAKNDCKSGLSCIDRLCQPTNYEGLEVSGKDCIRHQCEETADCCGDKPTNPPSKCNGVESICSNPSLPGCTASYCTSDAQCAGGTCDKTGSTQRCTKSNRLCTSDASCYQDTCEQSYQYGYGGDGYVGTCSVSGVSCDEDSDCSYFGDTCPEADYGYCDCENTLYDPTDPICSDPECEDVCTLICESNLCVEDDDCKDDSECPSATPHCQSGQCVQCEEDDECDEEEGEECRLGACVKPCKYDQECSAFSECQAGECIYVGCKSDTDCVLLPGASDSSRLAICVEKNGVGDCRFPCDNDSHCSETSLCDDGVCQYIGCQTDAQCDRLLELDSQNITKDRPYVTQGRCVDLQQLTTEDDE